MKLLSKEETNTVKAFLEVAIPEYILTYSDDQIDFLDCYEIAFTFANELLRGKKIDPDVSPWGDGQSVIFDSYYSMVLSNILNSNLGANISNYCNLSLKVLDIFKNHFI